MALSQDYFNTFPQGQVQMGQQMGQLGTARVVPDAACKVYGTWHNYGPLVVLDSNTVLLACACGDVLWKERPKNA